MNRVLSSAAFALGALLTLTGMPALGADASPAPSGRPAALPLEGTTWQLTNGRLSGAYAPIPTGVVATLILNDGHAGGQGGCNQWFADYALDGTSLTFGVIGSTLMLCEGDGGTIETFYLADLPAVASWAIDGATLTLSADDGQPVLAYIVQPTPSLLGTWMVVGYNDGAGSVVSTDDARVSVVFDATTVSGNAGCNDFSGGWTLDGGTLAIGTLMSTEMACEPAEVMARETAVMAALEASVGLRITRDGGVELLDAAGATTLSLIPGAIMAAPSASPAA